MVVLKKVLEEESGKRKKEMLTGISLFRQVDPCEVRSVQFAENLNNILLLLDPIFAQKRGKVGY